MKKLGIVLAIAAIAVAGVVGWNMWRGKGESMASSLPKDITAVGRVDLKQTILDYGVNFEDLKTALFSDKEETGLDYVTPAYIFSSEGMFGAIVGVSKEKDLEKFLSSKGNTVEEQRGMKWSTIGGNILMGFNDNRAMVMGPAVGSDLDNLRNKIAQCIKQDESESGKNTELFERLMTRTEPIALSTDAGQLPKDLLPEWLSALLGDVNLSELLLSAGLKPHDNRFTFSLGTQTENQKINKFQDRIDLIAKEVDASLLATAPSHAALHLEMALDGEKLLNFLRENKAIRTALIVVNTFFDFDVIMKNIQGDMSLTIPKLDGGADMDVLFQAQLKDDGFMRKVEGWNDVMTKMAGVKFQKNDDNHASVVYQGNNYFFATHNKRLTISNNQSLAYAEARNDLKYNVSDEMKGNLLFCSLDLDELEIAKMEVFANRPLSYYFQRVDLAVKNSREFKLELVGKDGVDILRDWMNGIKQ